MTKRVLDVGNCDPDHSAIRSLLERSFGAEVVRAHGPDDTVQFLATEKFDLVLVNRKLDQDYSDGLAIVKQIKADPRHAALPCMLITNYADSQQEAVAAGAEYGFGKKELSAETTHERLKKFLG
jgi:CheY-like chemotaxis protein